MNNQHKKNMLIFDNYPDIMFAYYTRRLLRKKSILKKRIKSRRKRKTWYIDFFGIKYCKRNFNRF
jgi:hypothetical protein